MDDGHRIPPHELGRALRVLNAHAEEHLTIDMEDAAEPGPHQVWL